MEEPRSKRTADSNRDKTKKKNAQEKKTKSETAAFSSVTDMSLENFMVVGKGCNYMKPKQNEFRLHECYSETAIPHSEFGRNLREVTQGEKLQTVPSNSSFTSAKSDFSDAYQKQIHDLEEGLLKQNLVIHCMKRQLGGKELVVCKSVSTETDTSLSEVEELKSKLKELERKISSKEKKMRDLNHKLEECTKAKDAQIQENRGLSHRVSLLHRQLQSMFELLAKKNWNSTESSETKEKIDLEALSAAHNEEKKQLSETIEILSYELEAKEQEINLKSRELVEYKNKSTLEMCKLINQIDSLQKEAKNQSEILESRISQAQISMEDEIVNITLKLEEQYQKDVKSAIEKFHADFARLADLPRRAIEQLLKLCEPGKIDFISYQKEWDKQQSALEEKIQSLQVERNKSILSLKDTYESKIMFLKTQVEVLSSQLKERKEIIDIFENELMVYKSNSSMNLLKASTLGDDFSALKELYTAEIFSQKQIHNLQINIFDEKVKTLTEEILYLAKNEEIRLHELGNAKKMAFAFREKYEQLVLDWEEKVERDFKSTAPDVEVTQEFDSMVAEFIGLIQLLKKTEEAHEEKIKILEVQSEQEKKILLQDIEGFRSKLENLVEHQKIQKSMDITIQNLIKAVGKNYTEAMETLLRSHVTELSYKQMEMSASEKRHIEEMDELKKEHETEVEDLRKKVEFLESTRTLIENEMAECKRTNQQEEMNTLKKEFEEMAMRYMKAEGIIAVKEETEAALNDKIKELENALRSKEENCRKELVSLSAEYLKVKVISAAKDDLVKEIEDKLDTFEDALEKSCGEVDRLTQICNSLAEKGKGDVLEEEALPGIGGKLQEMKEISGRLKVELVETFEDFETSKKEIRGVEEEIKINLKLATERNEILEKEKNQILLESDRMRKEICCLVENISEKEKALAEVEPKIQELSELKENLEKERDEIFRREEETKVEKEKILEKNSILEATVKELNERIDKLKPDDGDKDSGNQEEEMVSINLQEVQFLFEEEINGTTEVATVACQAEVSCDGETSFQQGIFAQFRKIQKDFSNVVKERNDLMICLENMEKDRDKLKEELEGLQEENHHFREKYESFASVISERDAAGMTEMNKEIGKLSSCVRTLSKKLDVMKASNDFLLNKSQEHFRQNQDLVSELEEAWSQRYEIEDQLAKVRKENALLNVHRKQLEETNKRISCLLLERKPSVVSWIKIHETVENIVEEVLSLKTSINDADSESGPAPGLDLPKEKDELKVVASTPHAQPKEKTMLCDELIVQKETLERELTNLEALLVTGDSGLCRGAPLEPPKSRKRYVELQRRQPSACFLDYEAIVENPEEAECSRVVSPNRFKMHLDNRNLWEEVQLREDWDEGPKMEILPEQDPGGEKDGPPLDGGGDLKGIELRYEEEVVELTKEFDREVEKLKIAFGSQCQENYEREIDELQNYFQKKWEDLEKRYAEIYDRQKKADFNSTPDVSDTLEEFLKILLEEESDVKRKCRVEKLLRDVVNRREADVNLLRKQYQEAVAMLKSNHDFEVRRLQEVVLQLRESILRALEAEGGEEKESLVKGIRGEYEAKMEAERRRTCDLLEAARQKHEKEMAALEEFWTEKLSECETRCALVKATGGRRQRSQQECDAGSERDKSKIEQSLSDRDTCPARKQIVKHREDIEEVEVEHGGLQDNLCVSCLANRSFLQRMEMKTDDDKLDVKQQRVTLEEMVLSMRSIVSKLLTFIGHHNPDLNVTFQGVDETLYKTLDLDRTNSEGAVAAAELSTIFQEIRDNSLLNSSDQVRLELEKCLKQLKTDATSLLALSCPDSSVKSLRETIRHVEREKDELEAKVLKVEEMQEEMKKEMTTTKERLSQWERNLEVVSEGYGEEIVGPKQVVPLSDLKERLFKSFSQVPQDLNLMEEICKEGDRLQEEWLKEKCDLQQQIDVADKQLHSLKKFLEEQALEREQEREAFDREISNLQENLRAKERDSSIQNRTNREVEALASQVKDLTTRLTETEKNKSAVEGEFQNAVKKIWSLREVIQELEVQLAEVSERENNLKKRLEKMDALLEEHSKAERHLKEELEICRSQNDLKYSEHVKCLEEELMGLRHVADQMNPESLNQLKTSLREVEAILIKKTKDLEQLHVSSANVSCSSPSEDVSIRDHLDPTRCSTPDEMCSNGQPLAAMLPMEEIDRVHEKLARHSRAEEVAMKYIQDLRMQIRSHRKALEEVQTERDVLLEKVDVYLKENSSLKVRLEEQRCNAGLLQKQLNANLESQVSRLEVDVEKLNEMCREKDKQLREMKLILENTTKTLKVRETEAVNKSREVNTLITTLQTDLANALNENEKLEGKLESTMEKLRDTMKMPALIESMIEEKNAEIDRLEKEVARLSSEKTTSGVTSRSYSSEEKHKRRIRFSEPDSFSENISSISVQCPSDMRNCSNDSFGDFRNSFKGRRPVGCSTKIDSISSIAPLQLSPRGGDSFTWKASSPLIPAEPVNKTPIKTSPPDPSLQQMEEISELQESIDAKQREISELHLEIDILKRQLVEVGQEVATAKARSKELQNDLIAREEEVENLTNKERSLQAAMESLKRKHAEEVEELESKLKFERGKVEKIYEEIKALEGKKVEIEEAFLSLKEDYREKINDEKKAAEALMQRIEVLESRNEEAELKSAVLEKKLENAIRESEKTIQTLLEEITDLKKESEKNQSSQKEGAETQVEEEVCCCQNGLSPLEIPHVEGRGEPLRKNLDELKAEFEKLAAVLAERDFNRREAFSYAMTVRQLLYVVLNRLDELSREVEAQMKKVMECSVDDLAVKVQKELVLSAKLDNQLLSSIKANGFASKEVTPQPDSLESAGDPQPEAGECPKVKEDFLKVSGMYNEVKLKLDELLQAKGMLEGKISEQRNTIRVLEDKLEREKQRIVEEKERCSEDAKIMELLRVNLEKGLHDLRIKDRELKKEKQARMTLEREVESWKRQGAGRERENKKVLDLTGQLESQKEKLASLGQALEEEKKKNQEAKLALEECRIERMSEKNAHRLLESDLTLLREQKENYKVELLNARKLLHSRNAEIGLLKRKINLQEIDIKTLALSGCFKPSETSSQASNAGSLPDFTFDSSFMSKMKKLNTCVQRHVKESTEMGEALSYLGQETEQMREIILRMEEGNETKLADETLVSDGEVEKRLWALEKERLAMDVETLRRENDALRRDLVLTCKNEDALREENANLKKALRPGKSCTGSDSAGFRLNGEKDFLQDRVSYLTHKYMRTESHRKALAWQKNYLLKNVQDCQRSEEDAWRRMGRRKKSGRRRGTERFRIVAIAAVAIFRMRFIMKRWRPSAFFLMLPVVEPQDFDSRVTASASVLNVYNEPVDPLSYQTQNIIRQPHSQVLRTPPCRDPGPRTFPLDSKKLPDVCDQETRLRHLTTS